LHRHEDRVSPDSHPGCGRLPPLLFSLCESSSLCVVRWRCTLPP
jgi:hypothetical protein